MNPKDIEILRGGNIHYAISDRVRAVDCGGLGVIQLLVKQLELAETIDQRVKVLERHLPYRESDGNYILTYPRLSTILFSVKEIENVRYGPR